MSLGRILLTIFVVSPMVIYIFCHRYLYGNHPLYLLLITTILIQSTSIQVYFNSFCYSYMYATSITLYLGYPQALKKKKAILLQAWTDPEGSRRFRLPDFKTIST